MAAFVRRNKELISILGAGKSVLASVSFYQIGRKIMRGNVALQWLWVLLDWERPILL